MDESNQGLRISKTINLKNELRIHIKRDSECSLKPDAANLFWALAKRETRSGIPCEHPTRNEIQRYIGYSNINDMYSNFVLSQTSQSVYVSIPKLPEFARQAGSRDFVSPNIRFEVEKVNGECDIKSYMTINQQDIELTRLHLIIRFISLKKIEIFNKGQKVYTLD